MAISKIIYKEDSNDSGTTWMNVTDTTAAAADVADGTYFYNAAGVRTAGTGTGGGSGLPPVTSSDLGYGLTVQRAVTAGSSIVPEQLAEWDTTLECFPLSNTNPALFTEGTTIVFEYDDGVNTYTNTAEVIDDLGDLVAFLNTPDGQQFGSIWYASELQTLLANVNNEEIDAFTISVNVADISYEWAKDPYPAWDIVLTQNSDFSEDAPDFTVLKGNYADLATKQTISVYVYLTAYTPYIPNVVLASAYNNNGTIVIDVMNVWHGQGGSGRASIRGQWNSYGLEWD